MRGNPSGVSRELGSRRSLSARGHFLNTFAGIGFSLAFSLLALGGYLIEQQFANPVEAQSVGLLLAALLIPTGSTLLYCMLHPFRKSRRRVAVWRVAALWGEKATLVARCNIEMQVGGRTYQRSHGRYVDHTLIRIHQ